MNLRSRLPESFILKYYGYSMTRSAHFSMAVWVVFLSSRGISFSQIGFLDGAFSLALIAFEVPTGFIGDRIGRRNSILMSIIVSAVASIGFAFSYSFPLFVTVYVGLAIAQTFRSGTDTAWLYDTLGERLDEDQFTHVKGRANALGYVTMAVSAVIGGYVGDINLAYPWVMEGVAYLVGIPLVLSFPETAATDDDEQTFRLFDALPAIKRQLPKRPLRSFILYTGILYGVAGAINFFVQPISVDFGFNPDTLGWLFAGFTLLSAAVSYNSGWIKRRFGVEQWFRVAPMVLGIAFAALYWLPAAAVPMFFLLKVVRNSTEPFEGQFINDHTGSFGRATVLSAVAMAHSVIVFPFEVGGGVLGDTLGAIPAISVLGGILVVGVLLVTVVEDPFADTGSSETVEDAAASTDD